MALHIGLNAVDPNHYEGWSGDLGACEFDANDMAAISKGQEMPSTVLLTRDGTRARVLKTIRDAAKQLTSGDFFFLSYSGHGGQVPDVSGEETDKLDETWCLYDGQLIDDELFLELSRFADGVRVLVLSDSCHSGTVVRAAPPDSPLEGRSKQMPPSVADRVYKAHQKFYDTLQKDVKKASKSAARMDPDAALAQVTVSNRLTSIAKDCKAAVILVSGCQDHQTSMDGLHNGAFTEQLLNIWDKGAYRGDYTRFHAAIKRKMKPTQTPNLFTIGPAVKFAQQQPFSV